MTDIELQKTSSMTEAAKKLIVVYHDNYLPDVAKFMLANRQSLNPFSPAARGVNAAFNEFAEAAKRANPELQIAESKGPNALKTGAAREQEAGNLAATQTALFKFLHQTAQETGAAEVNLEFLSFLRERDTSIQPGWDD